MGPFILLLWGLTRDLPASKRDTPGVSQTMNPDLAKQQEAFKKTLLHQPVIQKRPLTEHQQAAPVFTRTASSSSVESLSEEFRLGDGPHHINSYVHAIINFLKQLRGEVSYDDIRKHLNIDIDSNPELIHKIVLNERINVRTRMLSYKVPSPG